MSFHIEANLHQGEPRLRVFDADSGALRLHWRYRTALTQACRGQGVCNEDHLCAARANLHALMRELFLLSCSSKFGLTGIDAAADACMHCDHCAAGGASLSWERLARQGLKR